MNELCHKCPGYKECYGFPWFDWGDIGWCSHQFIWIKLNEEDLSIGIWPIPPEDIDIVQTSGAVMANFVHACEAIGEVNARLNRLTKGDREWLLSLMWQRHKMNGYEWELFNVNDFEKELPEIPKLAFHYITGWHRYGYDSSKWMPYSDWKYQRTRRDKKREKYNEDKPKVKGIW